MFTLVRITLQGNLLIILATINSVELFFVTLASSDHK